MVTALALCMGFGLCSAVLGAINPVNSPNARKVNEGQRSKLSFNDRWFSNGPGRVTDVTPAPRGGGDGIIHSGLPACDDAGSCDLQLGITGGFFQGCPAEDGEWVSFAFPVQTDGASVCAINIQHNTSATAGDLYLVGDAGGLPDVTNVLWSGCCTIENEALGVPTSYPVDPPVTAPGTTWVVAVFRDSFSFDVAYNSSVPGPDGDALNLGFGNLTGTTIPTDWLDLGTVGFGYCYCVSVDTTCEVTTDCCEGAQCDGDANADGIVDPLDSGFAAARFGLDPLAGDNCRADVNCDGVIDPLDTGYILARFNTCNPPILCAPGGGECGPTGPGDPEPPANDNCADAIAIGEGTIAYSNIGATEDGPADCDDPDFFTGGSDIWYRFTVPVGGGTVRVSTCGTTDYDSTLSVYSGSTCVGALLGCSDDDCGTVGGPSELVLSGLTGGQVLTIRVGGWDNGDCAESNPQGNGELTIEHVASTEGACCDFTAETCSITTSAGCTGGSVFQGVGTTCEANLCIIPATNDTCEGSIVQTLPADSTISFVGDSTGATADCTGVQEVWEGFTIDKSQDITIDYCGTTLVDIFNTFMFINMTSSCPCTGLDVVGDGVVLLVDCPDGSQSLGTTFSGLAAGTYWYPILVDQSLPGIPIGPYQLNVTGTSIPRDCCQVHPDPGCDEINGVPAPGVEECVCGFDPVCCETTWDQACVDEVEFFGCADCTAPDPCLGEPVNDHCECVTDFPLVLNLQRITKTGDATGATGDDCEFYDPAWPIVYEGFTTDVTDRVWVDFCDMDFPGTGLLLLEGDCPCSDTFVSGSFVNFQCPDGGPLETAVRFNNTPPGDWYFTVYAGDGGIQGAYTIGINRLN